MTTYLPLCDDPNHRHREAEYLPFALTPCMRVCTFCGLKFAAASKLKIHMKADHYEAVKDLISIEFFVVSVSGRPPEHKQYLGYDDPPQVCK
jgi:hypothetical protein